MSLGQTLFVILMVIFFFYGAWTNFPTGENRNFAPFGGNLILFCILALLGWAVFFGGATAGQHGPNYTQR